ncbi:hypothetical protein [Streptomyces albireticuli]|uniref:Secreted protein n=1 Tax=Streptomyces albireticuli TaxID=1940 RepID=A0A2A2D6P6_9ACTN|nr:hypothetical protein [Streptomyces albireticuli]MCD9140856.1 hypothetical protein [Streptomyces albireticuli]MCD9161182.1 hypothetical protein [Streptomyces albireticuli]MCD9190760.1 hypothetical protein [Streptomyces albireticuli]PAU48158.1 hypothetical protein CK936_14865 [Streptomyces albireticuli]
MKPWVKVMAGCVLAGAAVLTAEPAAAADERPLDLTEAVTGGACQHVAFGGLDFKVLCANEVSIEGVPPGRGNG